jgi:hypothetical protein
VFVNPLRKTGPHAEETESIQADQCDQDSGAEIKKVYELPVGSDPHGWLIYSTHSS